VPEQEWSDAGSYDLDGGGEGEGLEIIQEGYGKYRRPDEEPPEDKAKKERTARIRLWAVVGAVAIVLFGAIMLSFGGGGEDEEELLREITSLNEATRLFDYGDTLAVGMIKRRFDMYGSQLPFTDALIVSYLFLDHPVEVWVGVCNLQSLAGDAFDLLQAETDPATNPLWRSQSEFERLGRTITNVAGRGQRNYFFQDSNMLVWITADSIAAVHALNATLNTNLRDWLASSGLGY
jgi:hypothetical protein